MTYSSNIVNVEETGTHCTERGFLLSSVSRLSVSSFNVTVGKNAENIQMFTFHN